MSQQVTVTFENVDAFRAAFENSYNSAQAEQLFHCQKELAEANERIFVNSYNSEQSEQLYHCQKELAEANARILTLESILENKESVLKYRENERVFSLQRLESAMKENVDMFANTLIPTVKFICSLTDMNIQEGSDFVKNILPCFRQSESEYV